MNVHPFPVQSAQRKVVVAAATLSTLAALIAVSYTHLTLPTSDLV